MKITAIKQQVKNPERVSIFVDEKYSFSLTLDEVLKHKIKLGLEVDRADVKRLQKISTDGKLRMRSLEWLMSRPRSTREFRDYLYRKKVEPQLIEELIAEFTGRGYLDDRRFAKWFIELLHRRRKSNRAVQAELFKKGIDRELVGEIMSAEQEDEMSRLRAVIEKKSGLPRYRKDPKKLTEYLIRQGFSWGLVKEALEISQPED